MSFIQDENSHTRACLKVDRVVTLFGPQAEHRGGNFRDALPGYHR
jgi:hypothetical protein